jgi:hypothetical protein
MKPYLLYLCFWALATPIFSQSLSDNLYLYSIDKQTFQGYYLLRFQDKDSNNVLLLSKEIDSNDNQSSTIGYAPLKVGEVYKLLLSKFENISSLKYIEYFPNYRGIKPVNVYAGNPERGDEILLLSYDTTIVKFYVDFYQAFNINGLYIRDINTEEPNHK